MKEQNKIKNKNNMNPDATDWWCICDDDDNKGILQISQQIELLTHWVVADEHYISIISHTLYIMEQCSSFDDVLKGNTFLESHKYSLLLLIIFIQFIIWVLYFPGNVDIQYLSVISMSTNTICGFKLLLLFSIPMSLLDIDSLLCETWYDECIHFYFFLNN